MLKSVALLAVLLGQFLPIPPDGPATAPNPGYPLHVRILVSQRRGNRWGMEGFGRGNLMEPQPRGFDYINTCNPPIVHNMNRDEYYQARWKKPGQALEILTQDIGSNKVHKCELKISLRNEPYGRVAAAAAPAAPAAP